MTDDQPDGNTDENRAGGDPANRDKDKSVTSGKSGPASAPSPVAGPTAPAAGRDEDADKTENNRKGGYGTG